MTIEFVEQVPSESRTWAVPPELYKSQKLPTVILVAGALTILPTSTATAAYSSKPIDRRLLAEAWTNTGVSNEPDSSVADGPSFAEGVTEARRKSGLTWEQMATIFDVDRRSVHLWASGRAMSAMNAEKLGRLLGVIRRAERLSPPAVRAWLLSADKQGRLPIDLLREGRFDEVVVPDSSAVRTARPAPVDETVRRTRAPRPPEELVEARHERVHIEKSKVLATVPLKASRPK